LKKLFEVRLPEFFNRIDPFETVERRTSVRDKSRLADVDLRREVVS